MSIETGRKAKKEERSMKIRRAQQSDMDILFAYDKHISKEELESILLLGRVLLAEDSGSFIGWLRWNLFWDNMPFLNMLFILEKYRSCGYGTAITAYWEEQMKSKGYDFVLTSSLSNETAQNFYRKLHYVDSGALLLPDEPLEIIFAKRL